MTLPLLPRPRASDIGALALALAAAVAPVAEAARVDATATTLLLTRPEITGTTTRAQAPLLELLDISASEFDAPWGGNNLRARVVAWGRWETTGVNGQALAGDVQLAYAEGSSEDRRLMLRAGRQFVLQGSGTRALYLDGGLVDARLWRQLGIRAFGGAPVAARFGARSEDVITGARVYYAPSWGTQFGASYTLGLDEGEFSRSEVGVDGRMELATSIHLTAYSLFSLTEERLVELDVSPRWSVRPNLELWAGFRRTAPDLWLSRNSIFSVFAEERRDELGAGVYYEPLRYLGLSADLRGLRNATGDGYDAEARARLGLGQRANTKLHVMLRRLDITDYGFTLTRLGVSQRLWRGLSLTADGEVYFLDEPINGQDRSYSTTTSLLWEFLPRWRAGVTAVGTTNPTWERRLEVLAKLTYNFSTAGGGAR
jgi:hypothetical protein